MNKTALAMLLLILLLASTSRAAELTWDRALPTTATTREANALVVTAPEAGATVTVLTLDGPAVRSDAFAVRGQVRYTDVAKPGHLQLVATFPDGSQETSRATAPFGPMGQLKGTSDWREFMLASLGQHPKQRPTRIEVSVVLPGGGTVYLGRASLVEGLANRRPRDVGWMEPTRLRLAAGVLAGLLAVYGVITLLLARRRAARALVVSMTVLVTALSCAAVGCAWAAMLGADEREPLYPLALVGMLGIAMCFGMLRLIKRRYAAAAGTASNRSGSSAPPLSA
jgi:hypothetical protein